EQLAFFLYLPIKLYDSMLDYKCLDSNHRLMTITANRRCESALTPFIHVTTRIIEHSNLVEFRLG
ncbi:unnamed protein product, partial [marine sediment metagenome]